MTKKAQSRRKAKAAAAAPPKWLPWVGLGLAVVILVILAAVGPTRLLALLTTHNPPVAKDALSLTILHTNDTWGYIFPCG